MTTPTDPPVTCYFDPITTRAWLDGPADNGNTTIAEQLLGDDFGLSAFRKWPRINQLLAHAQSDGVFGIPGHTIGMLHLARDLDVVDRHRVILTTPGHATLCSSELDTVDLLTDHLDGIDAAVHLLDHTGKAANVLLAQRASLAHLDEVAASLTAERGGAQAPKATHGQACAFPPLDLEQQPSAAPIPGEATNPPRRHR